ncbi:MAG: tandem-95 repeat protein [Verrucomicrobiia bacterium]
MSANILAIIFLCLFGLTFPACGVGTLPIVAIHDSELTRALETMTASGATPTGPGTTSNQWWITQWHYFVMPDSVKETLRSDGTAYTVVGDSNILAGVLTNADGSPKYPILISLASEAIDNGEIAQLTNYVAAGGFLFVGSSSFTRNTNGTTRGDFAISNAMGVDMVVPGLTNWFLDSTFTKIVNHPLLSMFPGGQLEWQLPASSDEISWPVDTRFDGEDPDATAPGLAHLVWQVQANGATVIAQGDGGVPYLAVKPYGKGYFIYEAAMQPLLGHGSWAPGMYTYSIFRNAIQWAFQSDGLPVVKSSPWPYPYNAAVIFRHDMEAIPTNIISIEASAQYEHTNGASGDYYFCTGTLRLDMPNPTLTNTIASLKRAITNDGATIYSHNGGLTNINTYYASVGDPLISIEADLSQLLSDGWLVTLEPYTDPILDGFPNNGLEYDYWHWGPDEILDQTNNLAGYASASAYALASISNSIVNLAGWGLTNGTPLGWASPYFNATREGSFQIEQQLGIKTTGDTKLSPFPHWTLSTQTPDKLYPILQLPVSDWFVPYQGIVQIAQAMEAGHTTQTVQALVDAYYNLGALINLYCHSESPSGGPAGSLPGTYLTYSLAKPRIWSTNVVGIYAWWLQQSNAQVTASYTNISGQCVTTLSITGEGNTNAAVELLAPSSSYSALQVSTNGTVAGTSVFRTNGQVIKVLVGTSVSNAVISYLIPPSAQDDVFTGQEGSPLVVTAPGVLANDTAGSGGSNLTALLVSGPSSGSLTLNPDGSFTYTPTGNFTGADAFSYQDVSGSLTSTVATVTLMVLAPGEFVYDTFVRPTNTEDIFPWVQELGAWNITNNALVGTSPLNSYGYAYYGNNASWNGFSVQAEIQYSSADGYGGGIGGRLNPVSGAHYAAWVDPEGSPYSPGNGKATLQLVKFESWTTYTDIGNPISLPGISTNPFTLRLTLQTNSISAYFNGVLITNVIDNGSIDGQPAYTNGTVVLDMWTQPPTTYAMTVDNVIVSGLAVTANNDSYNAEENMALHVAAPGVLVNDSGGIGSLTAIPISNPSHGSLTLTNNGGFTYTPANNFTGVDGFTYEATDGQTTSGVATVTITVNNFPVANNDSYTVAENSTLAVGPPGILANDTGGSGSLSAILVSGPSNGTLALTNNGSFSYTPANNFTGLDSFTYEATDGTSTSGVATVTFTVTATTTANNDIFGMVPGTILNVPAPGVLTNDTGGGGSLSALLASAPLHGILNLANSGGFSYQPTNNFFGIDDFTYQATDGISTSGVAAVAIEVTPLGKLLVDNFTRSLIWPWVVQTASWSITNNTLTGTNNSSPYAYTEAYLSNNWTDYVVQGQILFSSTNGWGGGISGRVNPTTGAHYAAWVYPEGSQGDNYPSPPTGVAVLKLLRYTAWGGDINQTYTIMAQVNLPNVGNNWHTLQLAFQGTNIVVSCDGIRKINTNDSASFASGGISAGMYSDPTYYTLSFSNVVVAPLVANDSYSVNNNAMLTVSAPGILTNDTDVYGTGLTAALLTSPVHGILNFGSNGGFTYTPTNNYVGTDSFTYSAIDGTTVLGSATVTITSVATLTATVSNQARAYGTTNPVFTVGYSGFVNGDGTNVLTGAPIITTIATNNSPVGNYAITISQGTLSASNYSLVFVNGTLSVTQAVVSVSSGVNANNKVYDGTTAAGLTTNNVVLSGVLAGDAANVVLTTNGYVANFTSANVSNNVPVTVSGLSLAGSASGNYTLSQPTNLTANITGLGVTISSGISANNKVYDGTTVAGLTTNNVVLSGVLAGDAANVVLTTNGYVANFTSVNVSNNVPVTVSGLSLAGSASGNYVLSQPTNLTANITPKVLTIVAVPPPVILSIGVTNGIVTITWTAVTNGTYRVQYINNLDSGTWSNLSPDVTAIGLTAAQTDIVSNVQQRFYRVMVPNPSFAANNKVYDGTTAATVTSNSVLLNGVLAVDVGNVNVTMSGYTANFTTANVGAGIPVLLNGLTLTGPAAGNYILSQPVVLSANITPATLTVSAVSQSKTYGLPNPPLAVNYNGFVGSDGTNVLTGAPSVSTTATTNSLPGAYPIVVSAGTLSAANYIFTFVNGTLTVVALPQLNSAVLAGSQITLSWPTIPGQNYQLEYKDNLTAPAWTLVFGPVPGTGNSIIVTNNFGASPQRFFKLVISQ